MPSQAPRSHQDETTVIKSQHSIIIIIIIYPLTARVIGAPEMISQPVFSIFPCSPLPSETCRTPGLSIPWCCLPTSSSVYLVFFPLSLCLVRWFWPDLMNEHLDKASTAYGMEISAKKTMLMTNNTSGINTEIKVNGQKAEKVTTIKYLGSVIADEGSKPEILSRIAQATACL